MAVRSLAANGTWSMTGRMVARSPPVHIRSGRNGPFEWTAQPCSQVSDPPLSLAVFRNICYLGVTPGGMPTTSSAPGKVYLFGEHAVVYGEPAVPCAIERRATVTVSERDDDRLRVSADALSLDGFTVEYSDSDDEAPDVNVPTPLVEAATGYVDEAVSQARDAADSQHAGFDVEIVSEIPLGAGLGSSAAVAVAGIDAATRELGVELDAREVAERAYQVEYEVQEGQASRADTFCSAMGGAVRVEGDDCTTLEAPDLPFVVGYDGTSHDTGELVAGVRSLRGVRLRGGHCRGNR